MLDKLDNERGIAVRILPDVIKISSWTACHRRIAFTLRKKR